MSLNAAEIRDVVEELRAFAVNARVRDVACDEAGDLAFYLETNDGGGERVLFGLGEGLARVHRITRKPLPAARGVPASSLQLASKLRGSILLQITAARDDRVVELGLRFSNASKVKLRFELFSKRPRWVLVNEQNVVELLNYASAGRRALAEGQPDAPPELLAPRTELQHYESRFPAPSPAFATNTAVEEYYEPLVRARVLDAARRELELRVDARLRAKMHKIEGLRIKISEAAKAPRLRREADLLRAAQNAVPRGAAEARVTDYYDPALPEICIPLDPAVPLNLQIEKMYRRARKMEDGVARAERELEIQQKEARFLERARVEAAAAADPESIRNIAADLETRRILQPARGPNLQQKENVTKNAGESGLRKFTSADGLAILVGSGARENDRLSFQLARGNDLWMHAGAGAAGAHVVVRLSKDASPPLETLLDAATLAVHFSKNRGRGRAEVVYTFAKFVRKPRGAAAGQVTIASEKRLNIDLDPPRLQRLLEGNRPRLDSQE
ncbi:MAG: DUF814 domain-containing protein [Planctomycetes bacterium]|nr:DUF814 domain-containing protein [Planctomycetota bacterium]